MAKTRFGKFLDAVDDLDRIAQLPEKLGRILFFVGFLGTLMAALWTLIAEAPWQVPAILGALCAAFPIALALVSHARKSDDGEAATQTEIEDTDGPMGPSVLGR